VKEFLIIQQEKLDMKRKGKDLMMPLSDMEMVFILIVEQYMMENFLKIYIMGMEFIQQSMV
jgi:hypothetical protein